MESELVEIKNLFSTPFWHYKMNEDFRLFFFEFLSRNFDFTKPSGVYLDDVNLFEQGNFSQEMNKLKTEVLKIIESQLGNSFKETVKFERAWLCGTGSNHYVEYHNHNGAAISSVLYFYVNESRKLVFHDPRPNANRGYNAHLLKAFNLKDYAWQPTSGDIVIFPSFLYHSVLHHPAPSKRIAIAMDFFIES